MQYESSKTSKNGNHKVKKELRKIYCAKKGIIAFLRMIKDKECEGGKHFM